MTQTPAERRGRFPYPTLPSYSSSTFISTYRPDSPAPEQEPGVDLEILSEKSQSPASPTQGDLPIRRASSLSSLSSSRSNRRASRTRHRSPRSPRRSRGRSPRSPRRSREQWGRRSRERSYRRYRSHSRSRSDSPRRRRWRRSRSSSRGPRPAYERRRPFGRYEVSCLHSPCMVSDTCPLGPLPADPREGLPGPLGSEGLLRPVPEWEPIRQPRQRQTPQAGVPLPAGQVSILPLEV